MKTNDWDHHMPPYQSPRWANEEMRPSGRGVWGAMAGCESPDGSRWIFMPIWGPPAKDAPNFKFSYGDAVRGSVMAFQVVLDNDKPTVIPVWRSRDMHVPDPPVVANGVVYALQTGEKTVQRTETPKIRTTAVTNAILYAFDAETGNELQGIDEASSEIYRCRVLPSTISRISLNVATSPLLAAFMIMDITKAWASVLASGKSARRPACRVTDEVASCAIGMAAIDGKKILDQRERLLIS